MTDVEKINLIRDSIPAAQNSIYLNAGSVGPLPTIAYQALQDGNRQELTEGRASMSGYLLGKQTAAELRQAFAKLVKADPLEIALTHHTTDGMNIAVHGLSWQPGDEIITTDLEHPGGLFPPYIVRQRYDVKVKVIEIPPDASPANIVDRFEAAITPRTRLLVFSHVAWNTGVCLPMTEIVAMGHRHHVLSVVDAAQAIGAIPLDLPGSGVDFYAPSLWIYPAAAWIFMLCRARNGCAVPKGQGPYMFVVTISARWPRLLPATVQWAMRVSMI
jgi:L-cysteine/cystine lyase